MSQSLNQTETDRHPDVVIEVHWISFEQALDWRASGAIVDATALLGRLVAWLRSA